MRFLRSIAAGCLAAAVITTLGSAIFNDFGVTQNSPDAVVAYLVWLAASFAVGMLVAGTIGLAWHAFCQANHWTSVHAYWIPGALAGVALGALWFLPSGSSSIASMFAPYGAAFGGLVAVFAWLIRRPDRDGPNPPTSAS